MIVYQTGVPGTNGREITRVSNFFDIFLISSVSAEKFQFFSNEISSSFCERLGFYFLDEKFPVFDGIKDGIIVLFHLISGNSQGCGLKVSILISLVALSQKKVFCL